MRIRIGNQTSINAPSVMQPFEYAVAHGFDAFEWFPDKKESGQGWTEDDLSKETRAAIQKTAREKDIALSVHSALPSDTMIPDANQSLMKSLELARDVGATLFNIHFHAGRYIDAFAESVFPYIKILAQSGIRLSIENTIDTTPGDLNRLFRHLRSLPLPELSSVGVCLDMGHANLCWKTRNDYLKYVDLLDPDVPILHMHMHENYGDFDTHLTVFTGPSAENPAGIEGLVKRLKTRGFSGNIIFEQWPQPPDLLETARSRLLGMIGNPPPDRKKLPRDFVDEIAEANQRFLSWRKRLEWIKDALDEPHKPDIEQLVYLAIYLRFIGTGEVRCGEDGGHYRPSNHSRLSKTIFSRLSQLTTPENSFVIRKIYPWLPSFDSPFMRSEPLTRIRDIAHRNDIPQELKKEIKVTLQNKLHRSAGPEDLATSEALLAKITAPGVSYPPAFVEEFRIFHEELREFFNARSLDEQLRSLIAEGDDAEEELINGFLAAKNSADSRETVYNCLSLLTRLRSGFGMKRGTATDADSHRLQLVDIGMEDFAFVLLSRLFNYFDAMEEMDWVSAFHTIFLSVENLRLSGFDQEECGALKSELTAWAWSFDQDDHDYLLRAKATLERCRRLVEHYCDRIVGLFPARAEKLGHALGVPEHAIQVFAEGDIRSHPAFQLSKLVSMLLKKIRALAGLPPWLVIVQGRASGRAVSAKGMSALSIPDNERIIALVDKVEGDEDIPSGLAALVAGEDTPLLSHLAVRSRQRGVVFVSCDDRDLFQKYEKSLAGKQVFLDASAAAVDLRISGEHVSEKDKKTEKKEQGGCSKVIVSTGMPKLLPLDQVTAETGGNKAFGARRLQEISLNEDSGFLTPPAVVIPFGVMEDLLLSDPAAEKEYRGLVKGLDTLEGDRLKGALEKLKAIIGKIKPPRDITTSIRGIFAEDERLMVRSSSNCEDAYGFSGAGVYESVANVTPSKIGPAVNTVWSSLWNFNAVMERRNARISHESAHMAVLIQLMVVPDYSFIMHTVNPAGSNPAEMLIECAAGLGETLASGKTPGSPYRMLYDKQTENVRMLAFADFSSQAMPDPEGGVMRRTVNYASVSMSRDSKMRDIIGILVARAGRLVERETGGPQDIEGLTVADSVYLVQTRPQQGIA